MSLPKFITLGGKVYRWRDVLRLRREQAKEAKQPQPTLFPMREDSRPASQTTVAGRYNEPTLFKVD